MPPKAQPKAKAPPRPPATEQRKRLASNAAQQPANKWTRRNTKTKEGEDNEDNEEDEDEDDNPWPEVEEDIASKSKGKKSGRAPGGTRGQVKKVPTCRYVLVSIIIPQSHPLHLSLGKLPKTETRRMLR